MPSGDRWVVAYFMDGDKCIVTSAESATDLVLTVAEAAVRKGPE